MVRMLQDEFDRHGPIKGVMHSFTGRWPTAEACLAMGLYVSFAGMLTYKYAHELRKSRFKSRRPLLVETDCPYCAPVPVRGSATSRPVSRTQRRVWQTCAAWTRHNWQ